MMSHARPTSTNDLQIELAKEMHRPRSASTDLKKLISRDLCRHETRRLVNFSAPHHVFDGLLLGLDVQEAQRVEPESKVGQDLLEETVRLKRMRNEICQSQNFRSRLSLG